MKVVQTDKQRETKREYERRRYAEDPDYKAQKNEARRKQRNAQYANDPEFRARHKVWHAKTVLKAKSSFEGWSKYILRSIKHRAKLKNLPFNLEIQDILEAKPKDMLCPILGIPLVIGEGTVPNNATVDRLIPEYGYVKGNISIISHKANTMKSTCIDPNELRAVANFLSDKLGIVGNKGKLGQVCFDAAPNPENPLISVT